MSFPEAFLVLTIVVATLAPAPARNVSPMSAMQYYVGSWACTGGPPGTEPTHARELFSMEGDVLTQRVLVQTPKNAEPFALATAASWDAKNRRYVRSGNRKDGHWWASAASPWSGDTEQWKDAASSAAFSREAVVRRSRNTFEYTARSLPGTVLFSAICRRS